MPIEQDYPENETVAQCTGECCGSFYLNKTIPELWSMYEDAINGREFDDEDFKEEIMILAPMVFEKGFDAEGKQLYSCRHWDEETTLCKIYDKRPKMCRDYPYQSACEFCGYQIDLSKIPLVKAGGIGIEDIKNRLEGV